VKRAEQKLREFGTDVVERIRRVEPPKLSVPSRSTSNIIYDEKSGFYTLGDKFGVRSAANVRQVKKFAQMLCAADFCKSLITSEKFATLREMYYTAEGWETGSFSDQAESNALVEDMEAAFGLKREDMGLMPEEDGAAVYGELVVREGDVRIDATKAGRAGYTIPPTIDDVEFLKCGAKRVLAVETMGMYHRLVQEEAWKKFNALIVGLKGQAARATRRFLKRANEELGLPVEYDLPTDKLKECDIARLKQLQKDPRYNSEFWQTEIKKMLEIGKKAEQQAFSKYGLDYVVNEYLPSKLH